MQYNLGLGIQDFEMLRERIFHYGFAFRGKDVLIKDRNQ